ncbi:MAG: MobA/MobL family protein [Deltaproteobacteria bacterium]|nr:MobA/MobL family protein [Deltaproteobacteria bacterium]
MKVHARSTGASAGGAAAYAAAEKVKDHHTGKVHDYTHKEDVVYSEILLPVGAPAWMHDREALWNGRGQGECFDAAGVGAAGASGRGGVAAGAFSIGEH